MELTTTYSEKWAFSPNSDKQRSSRLLARTTFDEVVALLIRTMSVDTYDVCTKPYNREVKNCRRPVFLLSVPEETFDVFFNGAAGLRAQYLIDAEQGQMQENRLIARLLEMLVEFARGKHTEKLPEPRLLRSLRYPSAKIWKAEQIADFEPVPEFKDDLAVAEWRDAALAYFEKRDCLPEQVKAINGIRAPLATELELKGAWLDQNDCDVVTSDKVNRRLDIHRYGYT